jgi:putative solute:sodium symporter small subunit
MSEDTKQAYWRRMRFLTFSAALIAIASGVILPFYLASLNAYHVLRFPLGYFLIAHLSVIVLAILVYAFFTGQAQNDRDYNMTIQF